MQIIRQHANIVKAWQGLLFVQGLQIDDEVIPVEQEVFQ
jgi:hypothetical protein